MGWDTIKNDTLRVKTLFTWEKDKGWSSNGGAKWFIFETTAKQNKFIGEKINKFNPKVEHIKDVATGNVAITSVLINSNRIRYQKVQEIMNSFNGQLRVDYLLTADIKDENNGNYHKLGGRKLEDHVCGQLTEFAEENDLEYFIGQRIIGPNGEIDIILITNNTSLILEKQLLQYLRSCDNYNIFKDTIRIGS